ncbi:hypothetical protein F3J23_15865 [Chryseobacterium sp. Tr-659]|uniref:hypothetical protein n=1 Tax=Chryseobacterium sp. Tr-659 TaxID=2608340 RepID=UPI00141E2233|nr:hypothetical protein [Chryseobacterium sp. Tr-659]NIF06919.1 hypothetical protein [Chryseobacterium sp. Tr-659]
MKSLLITCAAIFMSCAGAPSQKSVAMQNSAELLVSESQGGAETPGFRIIKDEKDFRNVIRGSFGIVDLGKDAPNVSYPKFPKDKKVVLYNLGTFRSGSHQIREIKGTALKNNILYVEVPAGEPSGGMEIQVISSPWFIFTVPSDYQFSSVELKYSK